MAKKNNKKIIHSASRRDLLKLLGGSTLPVSTAAGRNLVASMVMGIVGKAQAQSVTPRRYVFFGMPGGPPRWCFDGPLDPYNQNNLIRNDYVNTRFAANGARAGAAIHATTPITRNGVTLHMPHLWSNTIPTSGGGEVPMGNLLSNMLMMRGITMEADGHENNYSKQLRPLNSSPSLNGLVADGSSNPVPAVALGYRFPHDAYLSKKGIGQKEVRQVNVNPFTQILEPFMQSNDNLNGQYVSRRLAMSNMMNQALSALGQYSQTSNPGAENLFSIRSSAETLLRTSFGDLAAEYTTLYNKYEALIAACRAKTILGVTDLPVYHSDIPGLNGTNYISQTATADGSFLYRSNYADIISNTTSVSDLAENFAVAEYLLVRGYSSTVSCGFGGVSQYLGGEIRSASDPNTAGPVSSTLHWDMDEHFGGSYLSLILNSFQYLCLASCLNEFIEVLKSNNIFDETVIQLGSEMNRSPRSDQSGSDHGWASNTISLFSGAIDRPICVGNCYVDATQHHTQYPGTPYSGSWGLGSPVLVDGVPQQLTIGHATSTIAHLLRVQPIVPNNGSLVLETGNTLTQTVENARNE